jgi:putative transposase
MPTQARVVYDGAICHLIQRGNNKQKIFREEDDYRKFLVFIKEYKDKFNFELYNYCLMPNHLHLLMKILKGGDLSRLMQGLLQSFRFYYKSRHDYTGYLYQGRYKSKIIEKDSYLLECARYIERNPLRAGMVKDLAHYKWSSYNFYAAGHKNDIITENPMHNILVNDTATSQKVYRDYVVSPRAYEEIMDKEFKII